MYVGASIFITLIIATLCYLRYIGRESPPDKSVDVDLKFLYHVAIADTQYARAFFHDHTLSCNTFILNSVGDMLKTKS